MRAGPLQAGAGDNDNGNFPRPVLTWPLGVAGLMGVGLRKQTNTTVRISHPMSGFSLPELALNPYVALAVGFVLLIFGGDLLVRGATTTAERMGVSPLMIGLTLVALGTSAPELVTSLTAAFRDSPGIAVGNVVGSNIANILLILGVTAVLTPLMVDRTAFRRDGLVLVLATLLTVVVVLTGQLSSWLGWVMLVALVAYTIWAYMTERTSHDAEAVRHEHRAEEVHKAPPNIFLALGLALAGIGLTVAGARILVDGAVEVAGQLGVSDAVIGLTVVAVGTSLPELGASVIAAVRRQADIALGNVIGSNIYNMLFILGATAVVKPIPVPAEIARVDVWVMLAATLALVLIVRGGWRISRWEGAGLLGAYGAYIGWMAWSNLA